MTISLDGVGIMLDIETLGRGPASVVTQIGMVAFDLDDPETATVSVHVFLPIQPQLDMGRTVEADAILWWMRQSDAARARFAESSGDDVDELRALLRHLTRNIRRVTENRSYEIWTHGPQFDLVLVESLLHNCGEEIPWQLDRSRDLRTLMAVADVDVHSIPRYQPDIRHDALADCQFQLECYVAAKRRLRVVGPDSEPQAPKAVSAAAPIRVGMPQLKGL